MGEGAPKFEQREDPILSAKEKLFASLRGSYNDMNRGMPIDKRMEIDRKMDEAIQEAHRAGVNEEDIAKVREEARGQSVRDKYAKDVEMSRKERKKG